LLVARRLILALEDLLAEVFPGRTVERAELCVEHQKGPAPVRLKAEECMGFARPSSREAIAPGQLDACRRRK
jgi:hypothetical protein